MLCNFLFYEFFFLFSQEVLQSGSKNGEITLFSPLIAKICNLEQRHKIKKMFWHILQGHLDQQRHAGYDLRLPVVGRRPTTDFLNSAKCGCTEKIKVVQEATLPKIYQFEVEHWTQVQSTTLNYMCVVLVQNGRLDSSSIFHIEKWVCCSGFK